MQGFKKNSKVIIKDAVFFAIMIMLFGLLSFGTERALLNSDQLVPVRNKNIYRIRHEPKDSIDVIFLGDSLSYSSISPMRLWKTYGFTSYVCGQSGQKPQEAEEMLRTALSAQSPRLVILEADALFRDQIKARNLNDVLEAGLNYYVPVFRGHDAWKSLVTEKEYPEENYKGFAFRCTVKPYEKGDYMKDDGRKADIPVTAKTHLERIIRMCEESGAELVLLATPSPCNYSFAKHKALFDCAEEKSLAWLDMNLLLKEIGIDWNTDSLDRGDHLNLSGAEKVTTYLGEYLTDNYELPDHREDPVYASWSEESDRYEEKAAQKLKEIRGEANGGIENSDH